MKKLLSTALRAFVSIFFIILLLYIMRDKYPQILKALADTKGFVFLVGLLCFIAAIFIASIRLRLIVEAQNILITYKESVSLTFIGYFFNNFLPTSIGGDFVKAYYLSHKTDNKAGSYASIFVDRIIGLITMILMAFIALFFVKEGIVDNTIKYIVYFITFGSLLIIIFMTNDKLAKKFSFLLFLVKPIEEKLKKLYNIVHNYKHHKELMYKSFAISFASQVMFFTSLGVIAFSLGARIPVKDIFVKMPIVGMMSLLPSINGLGLREGSTVALFGPLIGSDRAFAMSILWLVVLLCVSVIGGVIYALSPQFKIKLKEIKEEVV
ncbi:MAG: lysylphosphatidylglycerol synthase transmembrane domain-containing protein [Candidatus Omnitrophota bacterium]|nr:lysylphosphatidylglycerol synthase transmembrane domain-containing protein [Candidatus Omnitrophota bacterium]